MHASDRLPDEALDELLDGTPSEDAVGSPLAAYLSALREDAETTAPAPSSRLQTLLAEGMDPAELEDADVAPSPTRGALGWRRRGHLLRGALVTKLAALGMLTKVAAAGAAVTVAASGAGVAGVLPQPAQHAFDDVVGRQVDDDPTAADERDEVDGAAEVQPEPPADTSTTPPLETDVPGDATDRDGEPGVDGPGVADDASDGRNTAPEVTPGAIKRSEKARSRADAEEAREERAPDDTPPAEAPAPDSARDEAPPTTANHAEGEGRDTSSAVDLTDRGTGS